VLARGIRNYAFEVYLNSPTTINSELYSAIYQRPVPWPHSGDTAYAAASAYIAGQLFPNANPPLKNVRDEYDNLNLSFAARTGDLSGIKCAGQSGFPASTCNDLIGDYKTEFDEIADVRRFFANIENPITAEAAQNFQELNAITTAISNAVRPPPPSDSVDVSDILATIQGVADIAGLGELINIGEDTEKFFQGVANTGSVMSALLGVSAGATALGLNGDGGAAASDDVQTTAGKLEAAIAEQQQQVVSTLNNMEDEAVLDSNRLKDMDSLAVSTDITGGTMNQLTSDYTVALKREFTTALVTTNWTFSKDFNLHVKPPTWFTVPGQNDRDDGNGPRPLTDMLDYSCLSGVIITNFIHPFNQMPPITEYAPVMMWGPNGVALHSVFFVVAASHGANPITGNSDDIDQCQRHWPVHDFASAAVFTAMFEPLGKTENVNGNPLDSLAFVRSQWWWRNFSGTCWNYSADEFGDYHPDCSPLPLSYKPTAAAWTHPNTG
jgi:hypothetical protein